MQTTIKYHDIPSGPRKRLTAEVTNTSKIRILRPVAVGMSVFLFLYLADVLSPPISSIFLHYARAGLAGAISVPVTWFALLRPMIRKEVEKVYNAEQS